MQLCCRSCVAVFPPWQKNAKGSSCRLRSSLQCFSVQSNNISSACSHVQAELHRPAEGEGGGVHRRRGRSENTEGAAQGGAGAAGGQVRYSPPSPEPASHAWSDIMFSLTSLHTDTNRGRDEKKPNQNEERRLLRS